MGNFDVNTGVVSGLSGSRRPGPDMTGEYIDFVNMTRRGGGDTIGYPKSTNIIDIVDASKGANGKAVNTEASKLPNLTLYLIQNPPIKTLVYTDSNGNSKIIYSTPGSPVQLTAYGSKVNIPDKSQPEGISQVQTTKQATGDGSGFLSSCCCSSMCLIGCGFMFALALSRR